MKIIDKYLTGTFLKSLSIAVIVFSLIICVTYIFDRIDVIFKHDASFFLFLLSLFYSFPGWISLIFPVAMLLATLFSIGDLARNNEITALRTAGMNILTISKFLIISSILITLFFIFFNNSILLKSNKKYTKIWKHEIKKRKYQPNEAFNVVQIDNDKIFSAKIIDGNNEKILGLIILKFNENMELIEKTVAREAVWQNGYLKLTDVSIGKFSDKGFTAEKFASIKLPFEKKPSEFVNLRRNPDEMSYKELSDMILRFKKSGIPFHKETVYKHSKLAKPFANIIMIFLGIPFAIKTARTAKIFSFALAIFIGFLYWGAVEIGLAMGMSQTIHPILAAWFPNIVFLGISVLLIYKIGK
ncbi:MAG: LptF/LptG family permease [Elusimicrobia bacterium]|nr:LptF/LptG family permease [Elusimicrobiota bacterium]